MALGDPRGERDRNRTARVGARERSEMVKAVMGLRQGRDWVYGILQNCGVYRNPFDPSPQVTAFNAGQMNVGQFILADIMAASPTHYMMMLKEAGEKDVRDRGRDAGDTNGANGADHDDGGESPGITDDGPAARGEAGAPDRLVQRDE